MALPFQYQKPSQYFVRLAPAYRVLSTLFLEVLSIILLARIVL